MYALNENENSTDLSKEIGEVSLSVISTRTNMRKNTPLTPQLESQRLSLGELFEFYREEIFDLLLQLSHDQELARELLLKVYRSAKDRFPYEHYQKFARLWLLQIAVEHVREHFRPFQRRAGEKPAALLSVLEFSEAAALLLRERGNLARGEIAAVLRITEGGVDQRLMHSREKLAQLLERWPAPTPFSFRGFAGKGALRTRIRIHEALEGAGAAMPEGEETQIYLRGIEKARAAIVALPLLAAPEFEISKSIVKPSLERIREGVQWSRLPWHAKLSLEFVAFAVVGAVAVFILPAFLSYFEDPVGQARRMQAAVPVVKATTNSMPLMDSGGRSPASASITRQPGAAMEADEFAYMDFPEGENYLEGSAPLAPSRKGGPIYRLIVQSENPKEMIPKIKSLFIASNAMERDHSGSSMPGGVYFDAVTTEADYSKILNSLTAIAPTKLYQNQKNRGRAQDRARVIIWVQQI